MKKIPTIFERDWDGDRSRVVNTINPDAAWVFAGEGWPTRKLDGTSCLIRGGRLFKRRETTEEALATKPIEGFEVADRDSTTAKVIGWVPVGEGPEDRWHREAYDPAWEWDEGTYELVGPKIQGNPENRKSHHLIAHSDLELRMGNAFTRDFDTIRALLESINIEGIVFHHPDGRMAKIKARDFGIKWPRAT